MRRPCGEGVWTAEARILADAPGGRRSAPWGGAPAARGKVRSRRGPGPDLQVVVHAGDEESPGSAGQLRFELVVHPLLQHRPGEREVDADPAPCRVGLEIGRASCRERVCQYV